jgi:hypothetical protein
MTGDQIVERGATFLEGLSQKARTKGGFAAKFASDLAEDAVFLRKLKPSLVAARMRGDAPTNGRVRSNQETGPSNPETGRPKRNPKKRKKGNGPNPFVVAGAALVAGVLVAKFVDWRGHAHPRD